MATLEQIGEALRRADAAGNVEDAKALAAAYRQMQSSADAMNPYNNGAMRLTGKVEDLPSRQPQTQRPDLLNSTLATVNGISASVPFLQNITDAMGGGVTQLLGGDYGEYVNRQKQLRDSFASAAPVARVAGELGGLLAGTGAIGATKIGAEALGLTGKFLPRVGNSALSSAGLSIADSLSNGETGTDALQSGLLGGAVGAALPVAGAGLRAVGRGIRDNFLRPIATLANRENEVTKRLGGAILQDQASGAVMDQATEAVAKRAGADVLNADKFGSAIRTLARTASNVSPEADNIFKETTQNRFDTQGNRAVNFIRQLMGGATDDLALQDQLRAAARATNKTAYELAEAAPAAKFIWTSELSQLLESPIVQRAIAGAEEIAANNRALGGLMQGGRQTRPYGPVTPNLQFWDIVQRSLRTASEQAYKAGDNVIGSQAKQLRDELLKTLDTRVPAFKKARIGAAGFFGAEDAIEAGRKAVASTKQTAEIGRAVAAMTPAEKDAFAVGFSSEIIDAINATRDRVNVITTMFGSESARKRIAIALGPQRARELEAYVKMEQILDMLRTATQGNSTTAKQLIQAGLMGGGAGGMGYLASGGDLSMGFSAATLAVVGRRGMQLLGKSVDDQVMKRVAEILASSDPALLQRAIQNASLSKQHMEAIDAIMRGLAAGARGAAVAVVNQ